MPSNAPLLSLEHRCLYSDTLFHHVVFVVSYNYYVSALSSVSFRSVVIHGVLNGQNRCTRTTGSGSSVSLKKLNAKLWLKSQNTGHFPVFAPTKILLKILRAVWRLFFALEHLQIILSIVFATNYNRYNIINLFGKYVVCVNTSRWVTDGRLRMFFCRTVCRCWI